MISPLCDMFGIRFPLFAFTRSPQVVVEVSKAGGMGVLGALAFSDDELAEHLDWIDANIAGHSYGVDTVMPAKTLATGLSKGDLEDMIPEGHRGFVADLLARHGVPELPPGEGTESLLAWTAEKMRPQVDIALSHPIKLLANALGPPPADVIEKAHAQGVKIAALCGAVRHARKHVEAGVDVVIAQGTEAGGHTGEVATMVLTPEIVDAVHPTPVLAAGGIGSGRQIAAALALGAAGAWTGSIWLTTQEALVIQVLKDKLVQATSRDTIRTRALTGKPARLLRSGWVEAWEAKENPDPLPMPLQYMLSADAVARLHRFADQPGAKSLIWSPVGQIVGRMNDQPTVAELMGRLKREFNETTARLGQMGVLT
jgi:NAD(P)H-dependent flavin oxidoreductase YrpB (nitropropane dioxygenase family)